MKKIVFLDIDGTLKHDDGTISPGTISTIRKLVEMGIYVVLCGGRPRYYVEDIQRQIGSSKYIITSNGAEIYDIEKGAVVYDNCISYTDLQYLYQLALKYDVRFSLCIKNKEYLNRIIRNENQELISDNIESLMKENNIKSFFIMGSREVIIKLNIEINNTDTLRVAESSLNLNGSNFSNDDWISVVSKSTSKGSAITKVCKFLEINLEDTIGIGNDYNDIPMFETVGLSVVIKDANDEVKKYADIVTLSNNEDGVDSALKEIYKELLFL